MRKMAVDFNWGGKGKVLQRKKKERELNNIMEVLKYYNEIYVYLKIYV